jgi:molybdopterin/thiamine biosynthesis adenylyltransferase
MEIVFVGAGGINSWAIKNISELLPTISKEKNFTITIYDEDVVEEKNIVGQNQNFIVDDLLMPKAECLGIRYGFMFANQFITEKNIESLNVADIVILGVDNNKTRKLIYEHCINKSIKLLDLRAQGTMMGYVYVKDYEIDERQKMIDFYNKTYFGNEKVMELKGSCQRQSDIENEHIENGNKAIAFLGIYCILLKIIREEELNTLDWKWVY